MGLLQMIVKMALDASGFEVGLKRSQSKAREFGSELSSELGNKIKGIFSLAAMEEGIRRTVEFGSKIQDLSTRTGIGTDDLQIFDFAAQKAGTTLEAVTGSVEKLQISLAKAKAGDPGALAALQRFNIDPSQISSGTEAFRMLSDSISNAQEITGAMQADLKELMGKGALDTLAVLREDVRATGEELRNMGGIMSPETIAGLDEFDDQMKQIWVSIRSMIGGVLHLISTCINQMINLAQATWGFVTALVSGENPFKAFQQVFDTDFQMDLEKKEAAEAKRAKGKLHPELDDKEQKAREAKAQRDFERDEEQGLRELARIREQVEEKARKNRMESMTDSEKLKQINAEMDEAWKAANESRSNLDKAKAQKRFEELDEERRKIDEHQKKKNEDTLTLKTSSDSQISIGNILGVDPNRPVVDKLETIHIVLKQIEGNTSGSGSTTTGSIYPDS